MSQAHAAESQSCRNCGESLEFERRPNYCPRCGQQTTLHPPSVWEFVHEFIGHYVAFEGKLWKTLALLMLKPGQLTREYLAGRRERYVLPLRLYLTASFVFFVLVKLFSHPALPQAVAPGVPGSGVVSSAPAVRGGSAAVLCDEADAVCDTINRWFGPAVQRWRDHPQAAQTQLRNRFTGNLPYAMFALLPLFAALVQLAYRGRRMRYGEHLVFSFHLHAFFFIVLLAVAWLPSPAEDVLWLVVPVYGVWALQRVYAGSWAWTLLRALFIGSSYGLLLILALTAGMAYLFATTT